MGDGFVPMYLADLLRVFSADYDSAEKSCQAKSFKKSAFDFFEDLAVNGSKNSADVKIRKVEFDILGS